MLEPYVRPGIDDRPDLDKALSPEDKAAVARLAIKDRRRPPEASADQPEAQTVRLAAAGSSAAAAAAASVDTPAPDMSSAYLDMRDPMVAADGQRPTTGQVSRLNWGFFAASILVGAPWIALNTIAMPNAVARLFGYDTASAISVTINPATGRPLPVATDLAMPLAVLVIVGIVASMFAMPLISALSDRTRTPLGRRTPWMVAGGVLCALLTLLLGQNTGIVVLCVFWALMQFAYAMLSVPLASAISERVPDKFRPRIERWHGIGVMLGQALGVCMGAFGVMFDSFTPFTYTAVLFAVSGILSVLILPKEPSSTEQPRQLFNSDQVLDQLRPPAHAPAFARVFTARTCMMTGVGLTGVFLWYLVRFWVYGKAVVFTSAPLTLPAGFLIAGMAAATLVGAALASWAAGPISESIEEKNIPTTRVVAGACLLYAIGLGLAWGLGVWSTGTARENGMLLFALISGFAFGIYDSLGLELVMDSLPDPRRAGHDLGIYALANSAGLALAAIIGALLVNAFEHSFGYYLLFPSAIVMVLLAGIVTLTAESAQ
ncbi:MFS transporter [Bifidobacterium longum]|uniref:Transport protein n=1 Tax=Bifidobacterium longum subsp. longum TaxID=1679 RepID=A0A4R0T1R2_BIFLL|nr:MFS transporter [Bifidobacterium longum]TCD87265.1 transport protein [Bifidobacterium longum subsp. longum]TCE21340.1 transport protein [Bifidobacterium longum subsp. longum]